MDLPTRFGAMSYEASPVEGRRGLLHLENRPRRIPSARRSAAGSTGKDDAFPWQGNMNRVTSYSILFHIAMFYSIFIYNILL